MRQTKEGRDINSYEIYQSLPQEVLELKSDRPTVDYTKKLNYFTKIKWFRPIQKTIKELSQEKFWKYNRYENFILNTWVDTEDDYLLFILGSLDRRNEGIHTTVIKYDKFTFEKGRKLALHYLKKIYRTIDFGTIVPSKPNFKPIPEQDWDKEELELPKPIYNCTYIYNNKVYSSEYSTKLYCPSFRKINIVEDHPYRYKIENKKFIFNSTDITIDNFIQTVDVSNLFYGELLPSGLVWPHGIKGILIPHRAILQLRHSYPLFGWLYPKINTRANKHYQLKPNTYRKFCNIATEFIKVEGSQNVELYWEEAKSKDYAVENYDDWDESYQ